jgi:acetyl-CoA carboxylase carboxyl transferase subunit alpha
MRSSAGDHLHPDFERPIVAAVKELEALRGAQQKGAGEDLSREIREKESQVEALKREIVLHLTPIQRVRLARHALRPSSTDLLEHMGQDLFELHGDRGFRDDPAILTALGRIGAHRVLFVGHRKGSKDDVASQKLCNWGMANPEGYRKAMLKMRLAEQCPFSN